MRLSSPSFRHDGDIPVRHTCEGADVSPALDIADVPAGTRSLVLIVEDPDAPDPRAPKMTFTHWILCDLPPDTRHLAEGATPRGARAGVSDWGHGRWKGPCPPIGRHRYFFRLYALDTELGDRGPLSRADLLRAIHGHVLAEAELMGRYEKRAHTGAHPPP